MNNIKVLRDKACLSYWFPKLAATGVLVPRTEIVTTDVELWRMLEPDGEIPGLNEFAEQLNKAMHSVGGPPCFLRTGHGSDKHGWVRTCFIGSHTAAATNMTEHERWRNVLLSHVYQLIEWSHMVDIMELPTKVWAVRELLPLRAPFTAYRGMPIAREFRVFIADGGIVCVHPYWPKEALEEGNPSTSDWYEVYSRLMTLNGQENRSLRETAREVADAFAADGVWSLDLAQHDDGRWFAIDMAPAELSFHWSGCQNELRWKATR